MTSRDEALALLKEAREALHWQKWLWEAGYVRRESSLSADRTIQRKNDLMDDAIAKIDALLAASDGEQKAPVHTDHPLRHWDRTCPACVGEDEQTMAAGSNIPTASPVSDSPTPAAAPSDAPDTIVLRAWQQAFGTMQLTHARARLEAAERQRDALQAKLDALMLEYCPHEMTPQQRRAWEAAQSPASAKEER